MRSWSRFFLMRSLYFYILYPKAKSGQPSECSKTNRWGHTPKQHLFLFFLFNFNFKNLSFSCSGGWCHTNDQRLLTGCSLHNCRLSICLWLFLWSRGCRGGWRLHRFLLLFFRLGLCFSLSFLETRNLMFSNTAEEIQEVILFCTCHGKALHDNCVSGMQHM